MRGHILMDMILFVQVVDNLSFSATAEKFNLSKSVVSKRITRLEESLGSRLLNRTTRKLSLTESGKTLYDRCKQIYNDVEEAKLAVSYTHESPRGLLRVNAPLGLGYLHITPIVSEFMEKYPEIQVDLFLGNHSTDMIADGFDLEIRMWDQPDSSLIARKLTEQGMAVCASKKYLKKHGTPSAPEDLKQHNCLLHHHQPHFEQWHFDENGKEVLVKVQGNFFANNTLALMEAAKNHIGIVMLPEFIVSKAIKDGELERILVDHCPVDMRIYALYPQNRFLAPKVRTFIDFMAEHFEKDEYWH